MSDDYGLLNQTAEMDGDENGSGATPRIGDIVHYFAYGTPKGEFPANVARAAIVTEVDDPTDPESAVGLAVLNPTGLFFNQHIQHGPGKAGHWGWTWEG
jgi:hypothetical protein